MTFLGSRLRHLLELLDGDVAGVYADLGLPEVRPRFAPVVRTLVQGGPATIRDLAAAIGVTHSAASQTVAEMARQDLVRLETGADARQRIVHLTDRARGLLPVIEAEMAATTSAAEALDAELRYPLSRLVEEAIAALEDRPMRDRIGRVVVGRQV
ncbi:MarR family transcriptional regulator [Dactylosporangium aurantiacum]|uniref:MarR family transcriptional regulator n=1 Tax=Dactylosporangium aurantiacum TaxID=35754 RepID=A0A9Q9IK39_9ACTN|nr:MarR family transcriptional regulator [Dactylosporangium aurantiacum]MDG6103120.1 MarR family transcriptional regulator [Dactylosporangium aurantiacum]UWZ57629.1 MarR family transcriptional regulator [Dactylosporangium aurantiacum]